MIGRKLLYKFGGKIIIIKNEIGKNISIKTAKDDCHSTKVMW